MPHLLLFLFLIIPPATEAQEASENQDTGLNYSRFPSRFYSSRPLTPESSILLRFNSPVSPVSAGSQISFFDTNQDRAVSVKAKTPTTNEVIAFRGNLNEEARKAIEPKYYLLLSPAVPLPLDANWYLKFNAGLSSVDGSHSLPEEKLDYIGSLRAFKIEDIYSSNEFDSNQEIIIDHTKGGLHKGFDLEELASFVSVNPVPEGFEIANRNSSIALKGKFEFGQDYVVNVKPGIMGNDNTQLNQAFTKTVQFVPRDGFVTLPAFSTTQNANGHRKFDVRMGNLENLHVRVKRLGGDALLYALKGYSEEYEGWGESRTVAFGMVPGREVYEKRIPRKAEIDTTETVNLSWDELSGGDTYGGYYFCAEGESDTPSGQGVGAQALIQLTDIGLAWKQTEKETLIYAFSLESGTPLSAVDIILYNDQVDSLTRKQTDAGGLVKFTADEYKGKAAWLDARAGKDRHVMRFSEDLETVGLWSFSIDYRYDAPLKDERRTLIFTDRDVYKPGEEVYFKAISRFADADQLLPGGKGQAQLRIFDPRNRKVLDKEVELSDRGSFDDSFQLPGSGLGWYSMELDFNEKKEGDEDEEDYESWRRVSHHSFQVEEYRVNTFEVKLDAEETYTSAGEIEIPLSANYYMGKPLSKSLVNWNAYASKSYPRPRGFDEFEFGDYSNNDDSFSDSDTLHLSENGQAGIKFELPEQGDNPSPRVVTVSAEVIDANQQTVAGSTRFTVHSSDFYMGIQEPDGTHRAGDTVSFSVANVTSEGEVHTVPVETKIKLEKEDWNTVKVKGAGGKITHRNDKILVSKFEETRTIRSTVDPETGIARIVPLDLTFPEAGDYVVSLEATDEGGRKVFTQTQVRVIGAEEPSWSWHDVVRIDVIPDKESYRIGEVAKVLVRTPVFGNALITTERGGVRSVRTQPIDQHETVLEIPVVDGDAPNLFTSVLIVRGAGNSPHKHPSADYRMGYCQLKVEDPAAALEVTVDTGEQEYYQPGEEVQITATVGTHSGQAVADAEVTLYAVDEGILSLTGYNTPDPGAEFHKPFPLNVWTGQSLSSLLPENPLEQDFGNKGYVIGGGGIGNGLDPDRVRKDFKAVAFWAGSLITDETGTVTATFKAPDNLTNFRVMAVVAEGNRFGSAQAPLVINKPLIIDPALPGFSNLTDQIDLSAVLHNNTGEAQEVEIEVTLDNHALFLNEIGKIIPTSLEVGEDTQKRTKRLTLEAGATETVRLPVGMTEVGEATWNWKIQSLSNPRLKDATESKLKIEYPLPLLRQSETFTIRNEQDLQNVLDSVNPRLLNGHGKVEMNLSNSRLVEASDAIDYLLKYPYGCVEQTTSSTLPWLSTQNMRKVLPGLNKSEEEIAKAVNNGLERLLSMQTSEGGLAYWPGGSEPVLWGSAYGGLAIAIAGKNGIALPKEQTDALWEYLSKNLRNTAELKNPYELSQRCLVLYTLALSGNAEPAYNEVLFEIRDKLPAEARSLLALAMIEGGALEQPELKPRIEMLVADANDAPRSDVSWYQQPYRTATKLLAQVKLDPGHTRVDETINDLMNLRRERNGWGSTYSNAWPLMALSAYSDATASSLSANEITLKFGDRSEVVSLTPDPSTGTAGFDFEGDVRKQNLSLKLKNNAPVYATLNVATRPEMIPLQPENKGFGITREYHKVETDGSLAPADNLMVGDLVIVKLDINIPKERENYIAIDDPLPAIFEAVNPNFKTSGAKGTKVKTENRRLYTTHHELKKERALFFSDYVFRAGDYNIQYLARVVAPGNVIAPPAKIEAMYEPERFGLSGTSQIIARPLDLGENKVAATEVR